MHQTRISSFNRGRECLSLSDHLGKEQIESRRLVTDKAIVAAVLEQQPKTVLDLVCGEDWLARAEAPSFKTSAEWVRSSSYF